MVNLIKVFSFFFIISTFFLYNKTEVIAHRGFSGIAPENTLIAFKKAIEIGADYIELDVHQTKDSVLVIIHDYSIDRTCSNNRKGKIVEFNFTALQNVRVGYSEKFGNKYETEKIPTLRESLQLAKGNIKVCVELKVIGIENKVIELINELDMVNQVIIFSFDEKALLKIRKINNKIHTLLLKDYATLKTLDFIKENDVNAIGVGYNTKVNRDFIEYAHKKNVKVFKWTVNNKQKMKELIDLNIDGIITNRPDFALKIN